LKKEPNVVKSLIDDGRLIYFPLYGREIFTAARANKWLYWNLTAKQRMDILKAKNIIRRKLKEALTNG